MLYHSFLSKVVAAAKCRKASVDPSYGKGIIEGNITIIRRGFSLKKLILSLAFLLLLTGCGTSQDKSESGNKSTDQSKMEAKTLVASNSANTESNSAPTKRTIDLEGNQYPWQWGGYDTLQTQVDKGEVVYLWSDAPALEKLVSDTIDFKPPTNARNSDPEKRKKQAYEATNNYIKVFVGEMDKDHPEQSEYLNKITAAGDHLANGDIEAAKTSLTEATKIRTGQ